MILSKEEKIQIDFQKALSLHQDGKLDEAQLIYSEILKVNPKHANSWHFLGVIAYQKKDPQSSINLINKAIEINPNNASFYSNLGVALMELKELDSAFDNYSKAIELNSNNPDFHYNLGNVLKELGKFDLAVLSYNKAIEINSDNANYYCNRAYVLKELKLLDLAIIDYDKAIHLNPDSETYLNYGNALFESKNFNEAIFCYNRVIQLNSDNAKAYLNLANALKDSGQIELAIKNYEKAIQINPNFVEAYYNLGNLLSETKQVEVALFNYQKAFQLSPSCKFLLGYILNAKSKICDWSSYAQEISDLENRLLKKELAVSPFAILSIIDSASLHYLVAKMAVQKDYPSIDILGPIQKRSESKDKKIRIGYYSADFHNHPVSHLMLDLFKSHDRNKFELIAFSFGPNIYDEMRRKVSSSFDKFIDVRLRSDLDVAKLSRELGIDIAVDLHGFTQNMRLGIFAARCAPIQVNYVGYPSTIGAPYIDYLITSEVMVPKESQRYYSEKIVYLPDIYMVNCKYNISDVVYSREEFLLPEEAFVYCCFNNNYKITPKVFDSWMRILLSTNEQNSVLWLFVENMMAATNLRKEAEKRGVNSDRLIFATRMPMEEHLARHKLANLFLDTFPYGAHSTCGNSLRAGLPVLTLMGQSYPSRVSAATLNTIQLPDLITNSLEEYEEQAIELAKNPKKLQDIKAKLARNIPTTPLYDRNKFTKSVEYAYEIMYRRYLDGES